MVEAKKRGRKAKVVEQNIIEPQNEIQQTQEQTQTQAVEEQQQTQAPIAKKRGRKPKGGKIIEFPDVNNNSNPIIPNVIIHFKCKLKDITNYLSKIYYECENENDDEITDVISIFGVGKYTDISYENERNYKQENMNYQTKQKKAKTENDFLPTSIYNGKTNELNYAFVNKENDDETTDVISNFGVGKYTDISYENERNYKQENMNHQTKQKKAKTENDFLPTSIYSGKTNELNYALVNKENDILIPDMENEKLDHAFINKQVCEETNNNSNHKKPITSNVNQNEIFMKIHDMEVKFHNNNTNGKRCSCFWDTCAFDTPAFYIPKSMDMNNVRPYGCFCSLNCALSYLQNEDIDASSKFERRQLLFNLYSNVVKDKLSIKPAPDPRYTLDKFYGNLSIQEWRSLLTSDRMLLVVDKPLTPELPELHTENADRFMFMDCMNTSDPVQYGKFKIRKVAPKQSKTAIVAEKFGVFSK